MDFRTTSGRASKSHSRILAIAAPPSALPPWPAHIPRHRVILRSRTTNHRTPDAASIPKASLTEQRFCTLLRGLQKFFLGPFS